MLINIGFLNGELIEPKIDFNFEIDGRFDISEILLNYSDEDFMNFINDKNEGSAPIALGDDQERLYHRCF